MDATRADAKTEAAPAEAPAASERARAHAYLDLWERHVVHVALFGPAPAAAPAPGRPPA
jgi:hypothetical protein